MNINTNTSANRAINNLKINSAHKMKSINNLSSGFQVNKAADNSAGFTISEKMKAQIKGLSQAQQNSIDGISLIKTAEGGIQEITSIVIRQRELIVQALNDTYTDTDKRMIQIEIDQLAAEIDNIAENTEFNTIKVLNREEQYIINGDTSISSLSNYINSLNKSPVSPDGSLVFNASNTNATESSKLVYGNGSTSRNQLRISDGNNTISLDVRRDMNLSTPTKKVGSDTWITEYSYTDGDFNVIVQQEVKLVDNPNGEGEFFQISNHVKNNGSNSITASFICNVDTFFKTDNPKFLVDGAATEITHEITFDGGNLPSVIDMYDVNYPLLNVQCIIQGNGLNTPDSYFIGNFNKLYDFDFAGNSAIDDSAFSIVWKDRTIGAGNSLNFDTMYGVSDPMENKEIEEHIKNQVPSQIYIQCGANTEQDMLIDLYDCRTASLGINSLQVNSSHDLASRSLVKLDNAINILNKYRATCGAQMNRLEHTDSYLGVAFNNLEEANARIVCADMAKETITFSRNKILEDVTMSLMAQSKNMQQNILSLLQ